MLVVQKVSSFPDGFNHSATVRVVGVLPTCHSQKIDWTSKKDLITMETVLGLMLPIPSNPHNRIVGRGNPGLLGHTNGSVGNDTTCEGIKPKDPVEAPTKPLRTSLTGSNESNETVEQLII